MSFPSPPPQQNHVVLLTGIPGLAAGGREACWGLRMPEQHVGGPEKHCGGFERS